MMDLAKGIGASGAFALAADGDVGAGAFADDGEVFGAVVLAVSGPVLVEDGVEAPMDAVLDRSVGARGRRR